MNTETLTAASEDKPTSGLDSALAGGVQLQAQMKKRVMLKIGYNEFLLPESANVNVVLKALSESIEMQREYKSDGYIYWPDPNQPVVCVEMVEGKRILKHKPPVLVETEIVGDEPAHQAAQLNGASRLMLSGGQ